MTYHKSIMAWGDYGPESVTGRWSANTYDADDAVEYVLKSDFEKVRFAADLGLKMAEVNDLWNTAETIKAALTQTTDKEPAQPDPVGWVCAIEQAVAVADAKRQKYATAAHEKPDPWAQNAAKSLCADDISAAIRALITQPQHDALAAHVAAEVAKALAVKPLVWVPTKALRKHLVEGETVIEMTTKGAFLYTLVKNYQIGMSWSAYRGRNSPIKNGTCVSLDQAKAAAQDDIAARIQSALIGAKP